MIRNKCIFCDSSKLSTFFEKDYTIPVASYTIDVYDEKYIQIPFNIQCCNDCKTFQTKYLGNLNDIYKNNHCDACGTIRTEMHDRFAELIINNIPNFESLAEIGAGNGVLSLSILNIKNNINYNIIDPYYFGIKENRNIINDYVENVDLNTINTNIIVMSHVFEHFYDPLTIIKKIAKSQNIEYVCLCFPDLETYIKNNTYNVLTPEHTYYIENNFLKQIFLKYGFETIIEEKFKEHSIFLIFKKTSILNNDIIPKNKYSLNDIKNYYDIIFKKINKLNNILSLTNNNIDAYIFPCSIHTLYLFAFGLKTNYFKSILDNSKHKLNKYLYGYNIICKSFDNFIKNDKKSLVILNGGCFNKELNLNISSNIIYIN
jgi:hypothetical protein